jgi:release factor glutamine methyltransferase
VALAKNLPESIVYATEIDGDALVVAEANCRRHGVSDRVRLLQGDLLSPLPERVQVIVANPPYVKSGDIPGLAPEIRLREPLQALDGGPDGLRVIRPLIEQAPACLLANGAMFLELGPDQAGPALEIAAAVFPIAHVRIEPDLAGLPRALCVYT